MQIVSNFHTRFFIPGYDVPTDVHAQYSHLSGSQRCDHWIQYRGTWSHVSDFHRLTGDHSDFHRLAGDQWNGYMSDTYFSGLVIRINDDGESYHIGRWIVR